MNIFKSYSEKSKARRALVQVYSIAKENTDAFLTEVEGKHGFYLTATADGQMPVYPPIEAAVNVNDPALDEHPVAQANRASWDFSKKEAAPLFVADEQKLKDEAPAPATDAFSSFAISQLTAPSNAAPVEPQRTSTSQRIAGLKIEKDRAQANGVKERSKGGLCRAVWDALDAMMKKDPATGATSVPSVADIKAHAEAQGWNVNNASIEYYQWRKFHGISGRGPKTV
jgi:hypothetical protein